MPGYELIGKEEKKAVNKLFNDKSNFFCGRTVNEFQESFRKKFGAGYAQAVTSCTAALKVAIESLELPKGSEIITSAFTFVATAEAILEAGMKPVFCEIDNTYNMDPEDLTRKINSNTRAIIPVHMFGSAANIIDVMSIANEHELFVIEDCAQGLGVTIKDKSVGTFGDLGCFSFDAGKTLGTGDGGMIITDRTLLWKRCNEYFDHGHQNNPSFPRGRDTMGKPGFNYRMTELQAAIGNAQLKKVNKLLSLQRKNYLKIYKGIFNPLINYRVFVKDTQHTYEAIIFSLSTKEKAEELYNILKKEKIITKNLPDAYDWHFAGRWQHIGIPLNSFPHTQQLLERSIAIMIFAKMNNDHVKKICKTINNFK